MYPPWCVHCEDDECEGDCRGVATMKGTSIPSNHLDKADMFDLLNRAYKNWKGEDGGSEANLLLFAERCKELRK